MCPVLWCDLRLPTRLQEEPMEFNVEHMDVKQLGPDGIAGPSGNAWIFSCRPFFFRCHCFALIEIWEIMNLAVSVSIFRYLYLYKYRFICRYYSYFIKLTVLIKSPYTKLRIKYSSIFLPFLLDVSSPNLHLGGQIKLLPGFSLEHPQDPLWFSNLSHKYQACTASYCKPSGCKAPGWGWKTRFCWLCPCIFNQDFVSAEIPVLNKSCTLICHWQESRVLQCHKNLY